MAYIPPAKGSRTSRKTFPPEEMALQNLRALVARLKRLKPPGKLPTEEDVRVGAATKAQYLAGQEYREAKKVYEQKLAEEGKEKKKKAKVVHRQEELGYVAAPKPAKVDRIFPGVTGKPPADDADLPEAMRKGAGYKVKSGDTLSDIATAFLSAGGKKPTVKEVHGLIGKWAKTLKLDPKKGGRDLEVGAKLPGVPADLKSGSGTYRSSFGAPKRPKGVKAAPEVKKDPYAGFKYGSKKGSLASGLGTFAKEEAEAKMLTTRKDDPAYRKISELPIGRIAMQDMPESEAAIHNRPATWGLRGLKKKQQRESTEELRRKLLPSMPAPAAQPSAATLGKVKPVAYQAPALGQLGVGSRGAAPGTDAPALAPSPSLLKARGYEPASGRKSPSPAIRQSSLDFEEGDLVEGAPNISEVGAKGVAEWAARNLGGQANLGPLGEPVQELQHGGKAWGGFARGFTSGLPVGASAMMRKQGRDKLKPKIDPAVLEQIDKTVNPSLGQTPSPFQKAQAGRLKLLGQPSLEASVDQGLFNPIPSGVPGGRSPHVDPLFGQPRQHGGPVGYQQGGGVPPDTGFSPSELSALEWAKKKGWPVSHIEKYHSRAKPLTPSELRLPPTTVDTRADRPNPAAREALQRRARPRASAGDFGAPDWGKAGQPLSRGAVVPAELDAPRSVMSPGAKAEAQWRMRNMAEDLRPMLEAKPAELRRAWAKDSPEYIADVNRMARQTQSLPSRAAGAIGQAARAPAVGGALGGAGLALTALPLAETAALTSRQRQLDPEASALEAFRRAQAKGAIEQFGPDLYDPAFRERHLSQLRGYDTPSGVMGLNDPWIPTPEYLRENWPRDEGPLPQRLQAPPAATAKPWASMMPDMRESTFPPAGQGPVQGYALGGLARAAVGLGAGSVSRAAGAVLGTGAAGGDRAQTRQRSGGIGTSVSPGLRSGRKPPGPRQTFAQADPTGGARFRQKGPGLRPTYRQSDPTGGARIRVPGAYQRALAPQAVSESAFQRPVAGQVPLPGAGAYAAQRQRMEEELRRKQMQYEYERKRLGLYGS